MKAKIYAESVQGAISAPSSKSFAQRYILMAGFSETETMVRGLSFCDDEQVAIDIIKRCGSKVEYSGRDIKIIPNFKCPQTLYVGESATSYRLSIGLLSSKKCKTEFTGSPGLASRPVYPLLEALAESGVEYSIKEDGFISLDALNSEVRDATVDGSLSSQFISSLILFSAFAEKRSNLSVAGKIASERYVDITIECLRNFGISVIHEKDRLEIDKRKPSSRGTINIEGDYSSAAFFFVLGMLASENGIRVEGLKEGSMQPDSQILGILKSKSEGFKIEKEDGLISVTTRMSGIERIEIDADKAPDLAPPISVIGIFSSKGVVLRNYNRLEIKESKRASEIIRLAESFGAEIKKDGEKMLIKKGKVTNPVNLSFKDHRMIMSAIIAGIASRFQIEYENVEMINKSYPDFLKHMRSIGAEIDFDISA